MKTYRQKLLGELAVRRPYYSDDTRAEYAIEYAEWVEAQHWAARDVQTEAV